MIKRQPGPLLETILPVLLLIALPAFGSEPSHFCETLQSVNRGEVDTRDFPELAGHVKVIQTLLDASPDETRSDLTTLRDTFAAWLNAVDGKTPTGPRAPLLSRGNRDDDTDVGPVSRTTDDREGE